MPHLSSQRATPTCPTKPLPPSATMTDGLRSRNPREVRTMGRSRTAPGTESNLGHTLLQPLVSLSVLFAVLVAPMRAQNDFSARFEEIKKSATDEQLYRFLYDLPKGCDLHNHQDGAVWPEWWYQVAIDPVKTHGDTFYARTRILDSKNSPIMYYNYIPQRRYD